MAKQTAAGPYRSLALRRLTLLALLWVACFGRYLSAAGPDRATQNVILVTLDGLRWQELFGGADESLINADFGGVKDVDAVRDRFWREAPEERRVALMPFFWGMIAAEGRVYGDAEQGSIARVTNGLNFSYPGYNEILTGRADPRIDSNDKIPNPNVTVLEWLHRRPEFHGRVAAFCSWDVFPFIINDERSGIPVNAGWQPLTIGPDANQLHDLNQFAAELPHNWHNVRYDYFTFRGAEEYLRQKKPRVLYVSLGETDDWAHARRYDLYLDAARRNDDYLRRLWETAQSLPEYAGKTSLVVTTDHGRGDTRESWINHGKEMPEAAPIWIAVLGPDTPRGPPPEGVVTQSQVAATVAALLGADYHGAHPEVAPPLSGVLSAE
jgi:hypothetical protein